MARKAPTLDLVLLSALGQGPAHGYALVEAIRRDCAQAFDMPESCVYPALHGLERAGLLEGEWTDVGGRRRRVYRLTGQGRTALRPGRRRWQPLGGRPGVPAALGKGI